MNPEDFDDDKADKFKNPSNSIQGGKWQMGFQGEQDTDSKMVKL